MMYLKVNFSSPRFYSSLNPRKAPMTTKSKILDRLGERAVLLPELISAALASNDRAKRRLTMLQEALAHGENQGIAPRDLSTERRRAELEDALFDNTIVGAR